jgi:hypothetical protein
MSWAWPGEVVELEEFLLCQSAPTVLNEFSGAFIDLGSYIVSLEISLHCILHLLKCSFLALAFSNPHPLQTTGIETVI